MTAIASHRLLERLLGRSVAVRRCRAENLCHSMRNGTAHMWVATGPHPWDIFKQADDEDFLQSNLRVYQGEATMEEDELTLVVPILGLYAELYALITERRQHADQVRREHRRRLSTRLRRCQSIRRSLYSVLPS